MSNPSKTSSASTRRSFLQTTAAAASAATLASLGSNFAHAAGSDTIRVGLVGCGGRGSGAAQDCCLHNDGVVLRAMGDVFSNRLEGSCKKLAESLGEKFQVPKDRCFDGFDSYKHVIESEIDLVILATPPAFRPVHIAYAVEKGRNIFAEKPVATDPVGVRSVLESAEIIKRKGLAFVCGTQRRHSANYIETISRIRDGAIGEIVAAQCYWNQGFLWSHKRQPEWSDMEWQIRNWLYFTWLSGDHVVEQHVHNIDVINWIIGSHPISAYGMGGRQVRTEPEFGHIFDHFAIEYEYPNGARVLSMCRQIDGCDSRVSEFVIGTHGTSDPAGWIRDRAGNKIFQFKNPDGSDAARADKNGHRIRDRAAARSAYEQEHIDLIASIRDGQPLNEAKRIAYTTLTAIMGRTSAYTGKLVTWDQMMESKLELVPRKLELGPIAVPPVAVPGKETLV